MKKIKFIQLPFVVQIAVVLTFYNTWVMIEEFVIDRFGYCQYLPFYKKGIFCIWDVLALTLLVIFFFAKKDVLRNLCFLKTCKVCQV
jgi:hypothetical protein